MYASPSLSLCFRYSEARWWQHHTVGVCVWTETGFTDNDRAKCRNLFHIVQHLRLDWRFYNSDPKDNTGVAKRQRCHCSRGAWSLLNRSKMAVHWEYPFNLTDLGGDLLKRMSENPLILMCQLCCSKPKKSWGSNCCQRCFSSVIHNESEHLQ